MFYPGGFLYCLNELFEEKKLGENIFENFV